MSPQATITALQARIQELETEIVDLTLLHETTVEHGTTLENELIDLVATLTTVARELEGGRFDPQILHWLIDRPDELGELGRVFHTMGHEVSARDRRLRMLRVIIPAGVALSAEKDFNQLLETILIEAQKLCNADGGMLYLLTPHKTLRAMIGRNETLGIAQGGTSGVAIDFIERLLYKSDGNPNHRDVIAHAALTHQRVNVADTYTTDEFDFTGMHAFDAERNYRTQSLLTIPLTNERDEVIGVLQLINATDPESGAIIPFAVDDVVETLILLASAALSSYQREEQLRSEINRLQIQIDPQRMAKQVAEITETDFFQDLQARAKQMRSKKRQ
ncbi:MAG: GAF domain-containing protein [Caldilineaceae bacterium]|nr:GAF domain-containing protein [Caldilineaceae bacterium]